MVSRMSSEAKKPMSFYIGDPRPFLYEQRLGKAGNALLFEFLEFFETPEDKYYAANLFEEKNKLVISKATEEDFKFYLFGVYNPEIAVYNLSVKDDREFFIDSLRELSYLKNICRYFGFEYELDETGCEM